MKTSLVTGANRGIGLALATELSRSRDHVVGACRRSSPALDALGIHVEEEVDVTSQGSLATLASNLGTLALTELWLNAGVMERDSLTSMVDLDGMRRQFEVNAMGPLRVVRALMRNLAPGSKVMILTSRMGSIADNSSGSYYGYRASKAAANAIGKSLANDLAPRRIGVFMLHPGFVSTDMVGGTGDISPAVAAERLVGLVNGLQLEQSGTFWHSDGSPLPW